MSDAVAPVGTNQTKVFQALVKVRFAHTDPAGIIFYPRYFEMLNQVMEDWFADGLGYSFREMVIGDDMGVPAVHVEADFTSASTLGDDILFSLTVEHLGRSSCRVRVTGVVDGIVRVIFRLTVVYAAMKDRSSTAWPDGLRARMAEFLEQ
ncbi:acyl-CoA thioesterase [Govanella unica]|uniref:Acyl-CoA thioesterase n=1 Tax=Govanella unica TaxID=2975056 RepID=A0A9X3TZQ8_9PROT|nr:hotdog domain-containing protein [Govania unica]MDA5194744.1 acyl-CoA thioesterase [Govania unica]